MTSKAADLIAAAAGIGTAQVRLRYEQENPLRRMASPDEVAGICLFLSSPLAGYVNGASIMVDGGDRPG
jgi:NAD(P)-dependent dehydrogenase (short-subunit alcohol dehydrogenase family)